MAEGHERLGRVELLVIFAFWTFMALLSALGAYMDPRGRMLQPGPGPAQIALPFIQYFLWALLTPAIFRLASAVGVERARRVGAPLILLLAGVLIAMFVDVVLSWFRFEVFGPPPPPRRRFGGPPGIFGGIGRFWFLDDFVLYLAVAAAGVARDYALRLRRRQEEAVRLGAEAARLSAQLAEARMAALRTQLNPHFLFNTLHAIASLVERDPKGVRRMIARLSELLRHTLEGEDAQETTLDRELELTQRYVDIMVVRFQGTLEVSTRVPAVLHDALVPAFVLQPLVENAIKHGVAEVVADGRIVIEAERAGDELVLRVLDNGPGLVTEASQSGVGLRNTRERLRGLYGDAQRLEVGTRPSGGAYAEVRLPYHTAADLRVAEHREE
jgi:two-component system LytT family sensor kinase